MVHEVENFFGCYLLVSTNPRYKGHTYIGFTVDPNRRISQHNRGRHAGGAKRTSGRGPWDMVLIVHGFPNNISALRFEWAWQNPTKSRRLNKLPRKKTTETAFQYRFRIVSSMLCTAPWKRLALTLRWLKQDYQREFDPSIMPPLHIAIAYGPVKSTKVSACVTSETNAGHSEEVDGLPSIFQQATCTVCYKTLKETDNQLRCCFPGCVMVAHTICLAKRFLSQEQKISPRASSNPFEEILPIEGTCHSCKRNVLWGDLIRFKQGCYKKKSQSDEDNDGDVDDEDDTR